MIDSHDIASEFMDYKYDGNDWWDGENYKDELAEGRYLGAVQLVEFRQGKADDIDLINNLDGLDRDFINETMSEKTFPKTDNAMTNSEKAVAELHRQGLSNAVEDEGKVFIGAWVDDLECTIDIEVHTDQVKQLAKDYANYIKSIK